VFVIVQVSKVFYTTNIYFIFYFIVICFLKQLKNTVNTIENNISKTQHHKYNFISINILKTDNVFLLQKQ